MNPAEVRYTIARKYDRGTADEYLDWLSNLGIETVDVGDAWLEAAEYILTYNPALAAPSRWRSPKPSRRRSR